MIPSPSPNHCTAAPVMKMAPSSAYSTGSSAMPQSMVVNNPSLLRTMLVPVFASRKEPVP
jgi:hypothetical protein